MPPLLRRLVQRVRRRVLCSAANHRQVSWATSDPTRGSGQCVFYAKRQTCTHTKIKRSMRRHPLAARHPTLQTGFGCHKQDQAKTFAPFLATNRNSFSFKVLNACFDHLMAFLQCQAHWRRARRWASRRCCARARGTWQPAAPNCAPWLATMSARTSPAASAAGAESIGAKHPDASG